MTGWKMKFTVLFLAAIALSIRLALSPLPGNVFDLGVFKAWGLWSAANGFDGIYTRMDQEGIPLASFPNYALFFPYLRAIGWIHINYTAPLLGANPWQLTSMIKLPGIIGDLASALLAGWFVRRRVSRRAGFFVFLALLFHPAIIYTSSVWGQNDSLHTFFLLAALVAISETKMRKAWAAQTLAVLFKIQSILLLPLILIVHLRRGGPLATLRNGLVSAAAAVLVLAPFWARDPAGIWRSLLWNVSRYPYVSANAMNIWWPAMLGPNGPRLDTEILFGNITYRMAGFLLLAAAVSGISLLALRLEMTAKNLFFLATLFSLAFFLFPTEIHERYLYPAVVFLIVAAAFDRRLIASAFFLSLSFLANLFYMSPLSRFLPVVNLWWLINLGVFIAVLMAVLARLRIETHGRTA
ncbi:hypothetical protein A3D72_04405 [Candidatus Uhrbacteria bacterium RIFCSPHIGHO2_02_FULL_57_19]|uniref:DUF2029 domain-containing protein n=1 Tax=Candidatus Uhrbacteria bacterium RIFCSPHIGHO2_02_FULL_57_19 TaxID=1802391 RepID=A0A1F7U4T1_9BACT|nr:MAG: hypothetical protein A3D72_04405 [Candidatus Uhrbacteria bacterium RIFCSPHIGHO2_02_FULL_57_19]